MRKGRTSDFDTGASPQKAKRLRCAIYTRKSTEEGLDQAFNSLDAQREACAAYIQSQRHEGWVALPDLYDDGGYSGGTMERPALKRLLIDVEAGRVDVIVVYKVDRLTRALSDFAKIVDVLDSRKVSFVSITQSFNTTSSMGRLTLNVLLSFAQFEREVISERVRDKVAASKKKGMWMGGNVPLGYDAIDRKLVINEIESRTVQHIFTRYLELGAVDALVRDLSDDNIHTKISTLKTGTLRGGRPFERGGLYHILANPIYIGKTMHKGQIHEGEHEAIIPQDLWGRVQAQLKVNAVRRVQGAGHRNPALLAGMISDVHGRRMTPSHAARGSVRYLYYVSVNGGGEYDDGNRATLTSARSPVAAKSILRLPAAEIEAAVINGVTQFLNNPHALLTHLSENLTADQFQSATQSASSSAIQLGSGTSSEQRGILRDFGVRIVAGDGQIRILMDQTRLNTQIGLESDDMVTIKDDGQRNPDDGMADHLEGLEDEQNVWIHLPRVKMDQHPVQGKRLIIAPQGESPSRRLDPKLLALIARARQAREQLMGDITSSGSTLDCTPKHLARTAQLGYLSPKIIAIILEGRQPASLTTRTLSRINQLPLRWRDQEKLLGIS